MTPLSSARLLNTIARSLAATLIAVLAFGPGPALALSKTLTTETGPVAVETVAEGLNHPWGMVFLPDGQMLVTERVGTLRACARTGRCPLPSPACRRSWLRAKAACSTSRSIPISPPTS